MTFEHYVNKLDELSKLVSGAPALSVDEWIWNLFVILIFFVILVIGWFMLSAAIFWCFIMSFTRNR